jgi:hypothetical protein
MAEDTWFSRDLPILEAVAAIESEGGWPTSAGVAQRVGADAATVSVRIKALDAGGFVAVSNYQGNGEPLDVTLLRDARQAIGQWPNVDDLFDRFVRAIEAAADDQPDEAERSRLRAVAGQLGSAGRDFAVQVTATLLANQAR